MTAGDDGGQVPLVRPAGPGDLATIVAFNKAMAQETEGLSLADEVITCGVQAVLDGTASASYYLLQQPNGPVIAQLMITREWSDWRAADVWWIQSVYVQKEHRKRGYFKQLYQSVRVEAQRAGAAGLRLYADDGNQGAHTTYEKLGMSSHYKVFEDMFTGY